MAPPRQLATVWTRLLRNRGGLRVRRERRVGLDPAHQLERQIERLVVLGLRRHVGLRAALLLALRLEMATQRRFAPRLGARLHLVRHLLQRLDIGHDALGLDRAAGRREVARRGEPQRAVAAAERDDGLHRALTERARAENGRALVVLQGAVDDFRRRGGAAVDQHDDRLALGEVAGARVEALRLLGIAAARRDNLAALEERIRHRDRLVEQAARIVADVDDVAAQLVSRNLRLQLRQRLLQALGGLLVELGKTDIADV